MNPKMRIKITVDILMTAGVLFVSGYQFWGDGAHEWAGAGLLVLFLAHNFLNLSWYKALFRGKYTPMRIFQTAVNLLVLVSMAVQMYSGIVLSRHVFAFLPISGGMALARRLHILGAYWGFLLMSLHLGLHWNMVLSMTGKLRKGKERKLPAMTGLVAGALIAAYGLYVFWKRDFPTYLFLRSEFVFMDYEELPLFFYLDYAALMGLWVFLAYFASKGLRKIGNKRK
ncbi:MAG: DUF4405 domain-containing protein [Eubacteriales bacterium]|nr:DUF4405 domain-containing protein [Eubacteriales bacterium]